jgi:hypothetical protein
LPSLKHSDQSRYCGYEIDFNDLSQAEYEAIGPVSALQVELGHLSVDSVHAQDILFELVEKHYKVHLNQWDVGYEEVWWYPLTVEYSMDDGLTPLPTYRMLRRKNTSFWWTDYP